MSFYIFFKLIYGHQNVAIGIFPPLPHHHPPGLITFFGLKQPDTGLGGLASPSQGESIHEKVPPHPWITHGIQSHGYMD
jgi:hypothetical protein